MHDIVAPRLDEPPRLRSAAFLDPAVLLAGPIDYDMYGSFRDKLSAAPEDGVVVIELSTVGGDPEVARMMGQDVIFDGEHRPARRLVFLGKAAIYSAGATFMSFFSRPNRYLTRGARLMIHERKMSAELVIDGPLTTCVASLNAKLNEIMHSIEIQNEGFANLIRGSRSGWRRFCDARRKTGIWRRARPNASG